MEIPLLGALFLPLAVVCLFLPARWMLFLAFFLAPFKASSVLSFSLGGAATGLQAGNFAAVMFLGKLALDSVLRGGFSFSPVVARNFTPLGLFVLLAASSALILTWLFSGAVEVYPAKAGLKEGDLSTLRMNSGHFTQTVYLVVNALFAWAVANTIVTRGIYLQASRAYAFTTAFIIFMGLYQLCAHYLGLPYPYDVINNNPGYPQNYYQQVLDVKRFSSVLTEPSAAAHWLAGFVPYAFICWLRGVHGRWIMYLGVMGLGCLVVATSTTGYAVLALLSAWVAWRAVTWLSVADQVSRRSFQLSAAIGLLVIAAALAIWQSGLIDLVRAVGDKVLVAKFASMSAAKRIGGDLHALVIAWQTFGLGAGWGSNRASSQLLRVISTVGIPGLLLLGWFGFRTYSQHARLKLLAPRDEILQGLASATGWAVVGMLLAAVIAAGDPNAMGFWVGLGLYMAALSGLEPEGTDRVNSLRPARLGHLDMRES